MTFLLILLLKVPLKEIESKKKKVIFSWGLFKEKKLVELKFITSAPPYRLNDLEATISDFAESSFRLF